MSCYNTSCVHCIPRVIHLYREKSTYYWLLFDINDSVFGTFLQSVRDVAGVSEPVRPMEQQIQFRVGHARLYSGSLQHQSVRHTHGTIWRLVSIFYNIFFIGPYSRPSSRFCNDRKKLKKYKIVIIILRPPGFWRGYAQSLKTAARIIYYTEYYYNTMIYELI